MLCQNISNGHGNCVIPQSFLNQSCN
jgi:hypothetical protein